METVDLVKQVTPVTAKDQPSRRKSFNRPFQELVGAPKDLQAVLGIDEINFSYFLQLLKQKLKTAGKTIAIADGTERNGAVLAYPTATAPKSILEKLPVTLLKEISSESYKVSAKKVALWRKKMHAGLGSSILRGSHIKKHTTRSATEVGAKGTDLFIPIPKIGNLPQNRTVSFAEILLLQGILEANRREYAAILFHDIVSLDTEPYFADLWKRPQLLEERWTYTEFVRRNDRLGRTRGVKQALVPTIDTAEHLSWNRVAPAGHALFAFEAILAAMKEESLPHATGKKLVSFISNGEDLSASPTPETVGWMVEKNIPICMVVTEKTENDIKGGQIALVEGEKGFYATIIETAQAKNANQLELFEKLGLEIKSEGQVSYFNTNMALLNYEALKPCIAKLVKQIGEDTFLQRISPELIENWKEQVDVDGVKRKYLQLEGAMGSTLLNLDRVYREEFGTPLVHFLCIDRKDRHLFFSPVKTAFDFFLQFYSDRFSLDAGTLKPINHRPGFLPLVSLVGDQKTPQYWDDIENVLTAFQGCSVLDLDSLKISGLVSLNGLTLRGKIEISNAGAPVALRPLLKDPRIENSRIEISPDSKVRLKKI